MAFNVLFLLAICTEVVNGLAYEAPRATAYAAENGRGWTPVPTSKPRIPAELLKRGLLAQRQQTEEEDLFASTILVAEDQTCGYLSGAAGAPYTCGGAATCALFPAAQSTDLGALACCLGGTCEAHLECINSRDYYRGTSCGDVCMANTFTLKCIASTAPYCNTAVWGDASIRDVYCAASSVSRTQTILTTYSGQEGNPFSPLALDSTETSIIISTTTRRLTTSSFITDPTTTSSSQSTSTVIITPTPVPKEKSSTPVGPIVGGVIGGVALLAAIIFGIFFIRRRNRKNAAAPPATGAAVTQTDAHHQQPPPPMYIAPGSGAEMDGSGVGKPPMVKEEGYYAPVPVPAPHDQGQYQSNSGPLSPGGSSGYDHRRESNITPISPQTQYAGTSAGSPPPSGRESYMSGPGYDTYPSYPPPGAHEMPGSAPGGR